MFAIIIIYFDIIFMYDLKEKRTVDFYSPHHKELRIKLSTSIAQAIVSRVVPGSPLL